MYFFVVVALLALITAPVPVDPSIKRCVHCTFSSSELIKKELECEDLVSKVATDVTKYKRCIDDLIWMTGKYVESKAKKDSKPVAEWLQRHAQYDSVLGRFRLEVVGKPSIFQKTKQRTLILPLDMAKLNQQSVQESEETYLEIKNRMSALNNRATNSENNQPRKGFLSSLKPSGHSGSKKSPTTEKKLERLNQFRVSDDGEVLDNGFPKTTIGPGPQFTVDTTKRTSNNAKPESKKGMVSQIKSAISGILPKSKKDKNTEKKIERLNQFRVSDTGEVIDSGLPKTRIGEVAYSAPQQKQLLRLDQFKVSENGAMIDNGLPKNHKPEDIKKQKPKLLQVNHFRASEDGKILDTGFPESSIRIDQTVASPAVEKQQKLEHGRESNHESDSEPTTKSTQIPRDSKLNTKAKPSKKRSWNPLRLFRPK